MMQRRYAALSSGILAAGFAALLGVSSASAQNADPAVRNAQVKTTETRVYGNWTLRCFAVKGPAPCDIFLLLSDKDSKRRVMSVSIAYAPVNKRHVIQIAVPLGVSLAKGLTISAGKYTSQAFGFRRCAADGCYVETVMPAPVIKALDDAKVDAKVHLVADDGKKFDFPLSMKGFAQAHAALLTASAENATAKPIPPGNSQ